MLLVGVMAAVIWGLGYALKTPVQARWSMLGLLYIAVLGIHVILPEEASLRLATGESAAPWLILGGLAGLVWLYRLGLARLRRRVTPVAPPAPAQNGPFSEVELDRYSRHIVLREIGGPGQRALKQSKVLVIGAGGLGSPALLYLAGAGVGTLGVIDDDTVALSNLARQVVHTDARLDMPKVFSAEVTLRALNPHVILKPYHRKLTADIAEELFADYDLILDGTDTFETRAMVNRACVATGRPLISGAIGQWDGQLSLFDPVRGAPCYACLFPDAPADGLARSCAEGGVASPLPGVIGTLMAFEAVKEITGAGETLSGRLLMLDGLGTRFREMRVKRRADCPVCGDA